ncbi:head GIN domain-containing protein [Flavobacterium ardleyense]|uniref:Head GIN domain-containing protein n=1 Tax=Flavobacterium ardleyense TaxID=2038737 RepID=A0ABW5Z9H2_9FLAO
MKNITKLVLIFAITLTACNPNVRISEDVEGNGTVVTEKRAIAENFSKVIATAGINVNVTQGTSNQVEVETDDNLLKYVVTKVENGILTLKIEGNVSFMSTITVNVQANSFAGLKASGGATISTKNTLTGSAIDLQTSNGSQITAAIEFDKVNCQASSGSSINVSGKVKQLYTDSSSGSEIDTTKLEATEIVPQPLN